MVTHKGETAQSDKKSDKKGVLKKQDSKKLKTQKLGGKKLKGKKAKKQLKKIKLRKLELLELKKKRALRSAKGIKYILDCTKPVEDTIIEMEGLEKFFQDRIKVDNKTNNLKDKIVVTSDEKKLYITVHIPFSKRYIKYLAKKYIKFHQLRDFLRVVAKGKLAYQLRYYNVS